MIGSASQRGTNCWFYNWTAVDWVSGEWSGSTGGTDNPLSGVAINGAEDCLMPGVGGEGIHPEANQPIRAGLVVPLFFTPRGVAYFALSPELEVICG